MDTIFAQATAPGKAGVAIVRISGKDAVEGALKLCRVPAPERFCLSNVSDFEGNIVDRALILHFPEGESFTGDAVIELHLHGSLVVVRKVLDLLGEIDGFRMAEAGEFTRRALENGKIDLIEVEALSDLLEAETETQRVQATKNFLGQLKNHTTSWRDKLLKSIALLESMIDFADEEIPDGLVPLISTHVEETLSEIKHSVEGSKYSEKVRNGFEVAIVGRPNAGKSSLINAIAGRAAALTSNIEGTTRDVLEIHVDLDGIAVTILDTAGLRETDDVLEKLGIDRAIDRANAADVRVFLLDSFDERLDVVEQQNDISVLNKADLRNDKERSVSGHTGYGVVDLMSKLRDVLAQRVPSGVVATRKRQEQGLTEAVRHLELALKQLRDDSIVEEVISADIRSAIHALSFVIGDIGVEEVLGEIFSNFCIGK